MFLNKISDNQGARRSSKRIGRGIGSGKGKTSGKGHKGQKARGGVAIGAFEGGQQPIYRRLPKRGFVNIFKVEYQLINLAELQRQIDSGRLKVGAQAVTAEQLLEAGLVSRTGRPIKLLARGTLKTAVTLEVDAASEAAQKAVKAAGGKVLLLQSAKAA
ncbi:MAG: rplO [Rickettsiales bacterium]|jgi:large subunit ribosomal protein L15|nr:rplO [Rickettsiales bacterium]